jgi:hypothetical protein
MKQKNKENKAVQNSNSDTVHILSSRQHSFKKTASKNRHNLAVDNETLGFVEKTTRQKRKEKAIQSYLIF